MAVQFAHDDHDFMISHLSHGHDRVTSNVPEGEDHETSHAVSNGRPSQAPASRYPRLKSPAAPTHPSPQAAVAQPTGEVVRFIPEKETMAPSRRLIRLVNEDRVFVDAKRILGLFPQVAYKLVRSAGLDRARLVTAFIISLFETQYFTVNQRGQYDPSIVGSQERSRNMLMGVLYGKKPIYLSYAGPYFYQHYPEYRKLKPQEEEAFL